MVPALIVPLLASILSAEAPVQAPPAPAAVKTRLDFHVDPLADLYQWVRAQAAGTPAGGEARNGEASFPPFLGPAVETARRIQEKLGSFSPAWGILDGNLWRCESPDALRRRFQALPEALRLPGGCRTAIREDALALAGALAAAYPAFLETLWPDREKRLRARLRDLEKTLVPREGACLAFIFRSLGMEDSGESVPVYLVTSVPRPGAFTCRKRGGGGICFVGVEGLPGTLLHETVLHETLHALDVRTADQKHAFNVLRERLSRAGVSRTDRRFRDVPHTLFFVQAAETVRRLIDPRHVPYGEVKGYYGRVEEISGIEIPQWTAFLDGKCTREEALDAILEAATGKGAGDAPRGGAGDAGTGGRRDAATPSGRLRLRSVKDPATGTEIREGYLRVYENRETRRGRMIDLHIVVLPALSPHPRPDPLFHLAGGPGVAATGAARGLARSPLRRDRDIVLVDQRGTGRSNPLHVTLPGSDANLQGYLDPIFREAAFRAALDRLRERADLTQYTTCIAMDDLDEVRRALGYGKIDLMGGSYGTRAALVYIRRHGDSVRCAVLNGVAPPSFLNPLYHARSAQEAFDKLCKEVEENPWLHAVYGDLHAKLDAVLARLERKPAEVPVRHPRTGERARVRLDREAFAQALRVLLYYLSTCRKVPLLIDRAYRGDYTAFAQAGLESNRRLRSIIAFGMLMCVTGSEDIPRIDPAEIPRLTEGTFLGDGRVRRQVAVAAFWPRGRVAADYGEPVRSDVPVLLLSGTLDPVTPPHFAAHAARFLPNAFHLIVPGAHGVGGPVIDRIVRDFLARGSVEGLDLRGLDAIRLPPIEEPENLF